MDFATSDTALEDSVLERPDYVLFDLDPFIDGEGERRRDPDFSSSAFAKVTDVAFALEAVLRGIGLSALVKTSGKTGLHVIVPIKRTLRYAAVREMAGYVGERLRQAHPRDITLDWQVTRRTGKVFIDANMNVRGKSISIAYSPRGLPGAPVSTPLTWKELRRIDPRALRVPTIPARIRKRGNPWNGWLGSAQSIEDALARDAATRKRRTEVHR